jgi:hypothetical protein
VGATAVAQSVEEIRADVDRGEYRAALTKINKALPEARGDNLRRYELLMARGEALLNLRQKPAALEAFRGASSAAGREADLRQSMAARAMVELLGESDGLAYRPKAAAAINIVGTESRRAAMAGLFGDRLAKEKSKIDAAAEAPTLVPMIDLMPTLSGLMALEFAGTGALETMTPILQTLGSHGRGLMQREVDRMDVRISQIEDMSGELYWREGDATPLRRGIHSDEAAELGRMVEELDKITDASEEGRRIARQIVSSVDAWDELLLRAGETRARARYVLREQGSTLLPRN